MEINSIMRSAYSTEAAVIDNLIAIATWWTSLMFRDGHFEKVRHPSFLRTKDALLAGRRTVLCSADEQELKRVESFIEKGNREVFNPVGLNVLSPRYTALQFVCPLYPTGTDQV